MTRPRRLEQLLADAELDVERLEPVEALERVVATGAVLIDIRSTDSRRRDGGAAGALHIPRTVLEWRLEPGGRWRNPHVPEDAAVVLLCDHGCSSLLAAASLRSIGVQAADVRGGFEAWVGAGLPVVATDDAPLAPGELAGRRPPDGSA
jgi:rhodanese-related sulfurtransferase